ncbi:MAG: hypothetical protein RBR02_09465 [Desulfuromonadaceae bacterium]|nr:hypothetical protein [Desulfuromonadaceae bacterium]
MEKSYSSDYGRVRNLLKTFENGKDQSVADSVFSIIFKEAEFYSDLFPWLNNVLKIYLKKHKFNQRPNDLVQNVRNLYSYHKRTVLRDEYRKYDSEISRDFYIEDPLNIEYPVLMLDRVSIFVYSTDLMSYMKDVQSAIEKSTMSKDILTEQLVYDKRQMQEEGYSEEEIESLMPEDIDERFSFIENRSILNGFKLQRKPIEYNDGSGKMLLWHTDGATYRYRHNPPGGAPISLAGFYNIQRIVYNMLLEKYPEIEDVYDEELIEETNFIPVGYEKAYLEFEEIVMDDLKQKTLEFFVDMTSERLKIDKEIFISGMKISINQIEVCWNQPLPFDTFGYLHEKMEFLVRNRLVDTTLHGGTPLLVSKIYSDIDPNFVRFSYKNYKKTKQNLRNEIVLGNELKTSGLNESETLSDMFFRDVKEAKRFVYSKFILQFLRVTEGLEEEKYSQGYNRFVHLKMNDSDWIKKVLESYVWQSEIDKEFKDIEFFDVFADQINSRGYVKRSFFRFLSDRTYRTLVSESDNFERCGRGKYRPAKDSYLSQIVCDYWKVRNELVKTENRENVLTKIYHSDTGITGLSNQ